MKRFFIFLCAALMTLSTVNAEVLFNEHFAQATETLATNTDAMPYSGDIAESGWTNVWGSGAIYVNTTNDLTYSGYKSSADATGTAEYKITFGKRVASPLSKSVSSGSVYMAGIVKISDMASNGKDYLWALGVGKTGLNAASSKHYARPYIYQSGAGFKFGIAKLDETSTATYIDYTDSVYAFGTYLLVVEYTFVDGDKNDVIKLYVNPKKGDKPASETCTPKATQAANKADAASFGCVVLNSSSSSKAECLIDELKVVTDWSELWDSGSSTPTPTISADESVVCGFIPASNAFETNVKISGKDLTEAISVASNNAAVVPAVTSIGKTEAEAEGGYSLKLTITPATGDGSAKITLSSAGAANKEIAISWTGVATSANIAALKTVSAEELCALANEPIVIFVDGDDIIAQDASGAIVLSEYMGGELAGIAVGDKISNIVGEMSKEEGYHLGFQTVFVLSKAVVKSSGNTIDPLTITLDNITKYGPALVKATGVSFAETGKFAAENYTISQESDNAQLKVPAGCDIIGEDIPAKADVIGLVTIPVSTPFIQIRTKDDVSNRTPTGIGEVRSETTDVVRSEKKVINGQLVIIKGGKMYNVIGVEL